jgi:hypothetical protein
MAKPKKTTTHGKKQDRKRLHGLFASKYLVCNFITFGTISVNHRKTIIKTLQTDKQQETSSSKTIKHVTYMFLRLFIHHNVVALEMKHERK